MAEGTRDREPGTTPHSSSTADQVRLQQRASSLPGRAWASPVQADSDSTTETGPTGAPELGQRIEKAKPHSHSFAEIAASVALPDPHVSNAQESEQEGDVMRESGMDYSPSSPGSRQLSAKGSQVAETAPIQGLFILQKTYTPNQDGIPAIIVFDTGEEHEATLSQGQNYYVKGFDLSGNSILYDAQMGYTFKVQSNLDAKCTLVQVAPAPPRPSYVGMPDSVASGWEAQIATKGCWFAAMGVLCGMSQQAMMETLEWGTDALYSITMKEIRELGNMLSYTVQAIDYTNAGALYTSINRGNPVMLSVPHHVVVLYAIASDATQVKVWDPNGGTLKLWTMEEVREYGDGAYV